MSVDDYGNNHGPKGTPHGGRFARKPTTGGDDDLDYSRFHVDDPLSPERLAGHVRRPGQFRRAVINVTAGRADLTVTPHPGGTVKVNFEEGERDVIMRERPDGEWILGYRDKGLAKHGMTVRVDRDPYHPEETDDERRYRATCNALRHAQAWLYAKRRPRAEGMPVEYHVLNDGADA